MGCINSHFWDPVFTYPPELQWKSTELKDLGSHPKSSICCLWPYGQLFSLIQV